MNVDILTDLDLRKMMDAHVKRDPLATLAVTGRATGRYLMFDENELLCGWMNETTGEKKGLPGMKKAFSGIQVISPAVFPLITETGKFSIVDMYLRLCIDNPIYAFDHSDSKFIDVGKPGSIEEAGKMFVQ